MERFDFICPECGGDEEKEMLFYDCHTGEAFPVEQIQTDRLRERSTIRSKRGSFCRWCGYEIPWDLGHRLSDINLEEARKLWREVFRDFAIFIDDPGYIERTQRPFICPECGGGEIGGYVDIDPMWSCSDPIYHEVTCAKCHLNIPERIAYRWHYRTLEEAQEEWREKFRDDAIYSRDNVDIIGWIDSDGYHPKY